MGEILWLATLLGAAAAVSVGPVFVTIVNEAATRGFKPAFRVILGSAAADVILMLPALAFGWLIATIAQATVWMGLAGAAFFAYLAVQAVRDARRLWRQGQRPQAQAWAFWKGVGANLTNPLTWTFWLAIGTPMMMRAQHLAGRTGLAVFTVTWFTIAIGLEAIIAIAVSHVGRNVSHRGQSAFTGLSAILFAVLAGTVFVRNVIL